jgi:hypothetical protein
VCWPFWAAFQHSLAQKAIVQQELAQSQLLKSKARVLVAALAHVARISLAAAQPSVVELKPLAVQKQCPARR